MRPAPRLVKFPPPPLDIEVALEGVVTFPGGKGPASGPLGCVSGLVFVCVCVCVCVVGVMVLWCCGRGCCAMFCYCMLYCVKTKTKKAKKRILTLALCHRSQPGGVRIQDGASFGAMLAVSGPTDWAETCTYQILGGVCLNTTRHTASNRVQASLRY